MTVASYAEGFSEKYALMAEQLPKPTVSKDRAIREHSHDLGYHNWGRFGRYEYLGAGTRATEKYQSGIKPVNALDRLAMKHDLDYVRTAGLPLKRVKRAISDYATGSGMLLQTVNPWSDLTLGDRIFGTMAGSGLVIQGVARVHPITALPMAFVDWYFY